MQRVLAQVKRTHRRSGPFRCDGVQRRGRREYVQVLRLLETFDLADLRAAVTQALQMGAIGFDAVKHLLLCRVERRPPRLDLDCYPYLPKARVEKTEARSYMRRLSGGAEGVA